LPAVEAFVAPGMREGARLPDADYMAFVDPFGGSADNMTRAIGDKEDDVMVIDALWERKPPFSPGSDPLCVNINPGHHLILLKSPTASSKL
jgi:hypothetical protein